MNTFEHGIAGTPSSAIIIGLSNPVSGYMTVPAADLGKSAQYFKSEYPRTKRYINVSAYAVDAVRAAMFSNSGLYDSDTHQVITDNVREFSKASLADLVMTKSGSSPASIDFAISELAKDVLISRSIKDAVSVIENNTLLDAVESTKLINNAASGHLANFSQKSGLLDSSSAITGLGAEQIKECLFHGSNRALLKCHTGFGKSSTIINSTIQEFLAAEQKVVFISPLRSIIAAVNVDGLVHYGEVNPGDLATAQGLKIVVNSIIAPKFQEFLKDIDLLVIDEVSQVINHVIEGTVENRSDVWHELKDMVASAKHVIFADADIDQASVDLINYRAQSPATLFLAEAKHGDISVSISPIDQVRKQAIDTALKETTLISCDVRKDASAIALELQKAGRKTLLITSTTISHADSQGFISNPNSTDWDVVIYSPAMKSAISITSGHFKNHFGLFEGSITPKGAIQMLRRDRTTKSFVVGARNPRHRKSELVQVEYDNGPKTPFETLRHAHRKNSAWLRDNVQFALVLELRQQGFAVEVCDGDEEMSKEGWKLHEKAKHALKADIATALLDAKPMAHLKSAEKVLKDGSESLEQYHSAVRTEAEHHLGRKVLSHADAMFWKEGEGRVKLSNFRALSAAKTPVFTILSDVFKKMTDTKAWSSNDSVDAFDRINLIRDQFLLAGFDLPRNKDISDRSKQGAVSELLKACGLKTKRKDGGSKGYYYIIDPKSLAQMKEYTGL